MLVLGLSAMATSTGEYAPVVYNDLGIDDMTKPKAAFMLGKWLATTPLLTDFAEDLQRVAVSGDEVGIRKKLETLEKAVIAIPATQPVSNVVFSSLFGVRSDPFRGSAAMHAGVDIPGAIGTPVYATADGIVARAERSGGYGNLVEVNHGRGIATRYGHLSKILVAPNTRVTRGQLIALMGSTGRSTGSHLHYEVRIDGQAAPPRRRATRPWRAWCAACEEEEEKVRLLELKGC
mgnify:CR=1 FL=1